MYDLCQFDAERVLLVKEQIESNSYAILPSASGSALIIFVLLLLHLCVYS